MTFNIHYCDLVDLNKLKEALIYLFPNQIEKICCLTYTINYCDNIIIKDDIIKNTYTEHCDTYIYDNMFVTLVNILKECDDDTFLIQVNDKTEYDILYNYNNIFKLNSYHSNVFNYLNTKKNIYYITEKQKNIFFKDLKTFDVKSYCRNIKLKHIYENIN